ncbi:MAG: insulinase family protein [Candidatus Handelsmanbacteria bacterium]|nr:insulinase family protein [Candidatus Handelsmanbacteria bacterium]
MRQILCPAFWMLLCSPWLTLPASAEHKLVHAPSPTDPLQVHIYELGNGLSVYLSENHQEPRFHAEIAVRAGSKHDPAQATGIAHYLEHMLFKGTTRIGTLDYDKEKVHLDSIETLYEQHSGETDPEKRKAIYALINEQNQFASQYAIPNEIDRLYSGMGENGLNAHTWVEETVYEVDLPANHLRQWAAVEAERFAGPVFRLFQTELETVYEEKNRSTDNKDRLINEAVERVLYKKHPYGQQTTLGSIEHLKSPSLKRMYEYYRTYYVPNNMAILISGDIRVSEAIGVIDSAFSSWKAEKLPLPPKWKEEALKGAEEITVQYPGEEMVRLAFRTAPRRHADAAALELLDMVLNNRVAGLIDLNLNQQQRVRQAGSYPSFYNDYGAQYLYGIPKPGQTLEEVQQLLLDQLELIRQGAFAEDLIPAIITDFEKTYKEQFERNGSRVELMTQNFIGFEDWERAAHKIDRMKKLAKTEVVRVAHKYFGKDYVVGYRRDGKPELPTIDKPAIDKVEIDPSRQSAFFAQVMAMPVSQIEPVFLAPEKDFQIRPVAEGVTLYYCPNPMNDLFSLSASLDLGLLSDQRLAMARHLLDKAGTPRLSPEALKREWYRLGTDFSMGASDYETSFSISGLDANLGESLALMDELLRQPVAADSALAELIANTLAQRADSQKDHRTLSQALYLFNRFGEQSPFRRELSNQQLQTLQKDELLGLVSGLRGYRHTLLYTGSLPIDAVLAQLKQHYTLPAELKTSPPQSPPQVRRPDSTEILLYDKEMAQALVRIEAGDTPYDETRRPLIQLYNEYFGGSMASIVFQELREARALAYQAWAQYFTAERQGEQNVMAGFIGCQADKTPEATAVFLELLDQMPSSEERFAAAKDALLSQYRTSRLGFRQILGAVRQWERQGLPVDPRAGRFAQLQQASLEGMLQFYREQVQSRPRLISIVGDKRKMDLAALGAAGTIAEVGLPALFSY